MVRNRYGQLTLSAAIGGSRRGVTRRQAPVSCPWAALAALTRACRYFVGHHPPRFDTLTAWSRTTIHCAWWWEVSAFGGRPTRHCACFWAPWRRPLAAGALHLEPGRRPLDQLTRPGGRLCRGAVLAFARLVDLVGALARPLTAGAGAVPGGVQLVGYLRPREAAEAVLDDGRVRFLLALVPLAAPVDELEAERRYPAGGPALRL